MLGRLEGEHYGLCLGVDEADLVGGRNATRQFGEIGLLVRAAAKEARHGSERRGKAMVIVWGGEIIVEVETNLAVDIWTSIR
ncbi:hypothetical protein [Mesorhizobium sp.]|uniref:hypothetical protein n=1 Tax=Mesorhizobium sp. TaxID=1871066 RepID=UPI000FE7B7D9|nr:hypothetical protein [Mesorhizobium sp.]RWP30312.1 MAG: hypothetical protein EOR02_13100 [Mesorhizobium sp.]